MTESRSKSRSVASTKSIDLGLPVILGWNTEDYGNHAVLVTGYWHGRDDWLLLNDPGGEDRISWPVLAGRRGQFAGSAYLQSKDARWTEAGQGTYVS